MTDKIEITNYIQKHILSVLAVNKYARFRDMRPKNVDSNLYSYHLKLVIKSGLVEKTVNGYRLTSRGLFYADRASGESFDIYSQPKIIIMCIIKNKAGEILLSQRLKQPFITRWTLPNGKIKLDDGTIELAARRVLRDSAIIDPKNLSHRGDIYVHTRDTSGAIVSAILAHIFAGRCDGTLPIDRVDLAWTDKAWRSQHQMASEMVDDVIKLADKSKTFFTELNYKIDFGGAN
ncbi:MAG: NUDIX hydrolase [Candidatus Nomurabacteria bacterium]|jgi:ADP-ribose pyrophosphatase YjhB (NUDIX family)|nr:NUDIX hydrolase [Candidatus Nomurabacteria bacterium]